MEILIGETVTKQLTKEERTKGILKDKYLEWQAKREKKFMAMGMDLKVELSDKE